MPVQNSGSTIGSHFISRTLVAVACFVAATVTVGARSMVGGVVAAS